jgi:predicted small integral membrane protein
MLAWMAWTWQTALFFCLVALALIILTLLAIYRPETPRVGILRFPTTRGDRFFVTLIGSAFIFVFWMRYGGGPCGPRSQRRCLRHRDVQIRVSRIARGAWCATGSKGGSNGRERRDVLKGAAAVAASAATVGGAAIISSTPSYAQQVDAAKKWVDSEFQPSTLSKDQQMAEME